METPISKSQRRAMALCGLPIARTYRQAAEALQTAGYRADGIPNGHNWRTAAKVDDADYLANLVAVVYERQMSAREIAEGGY